MQECSEPSSQCGEVTRLLHSWQQGSEAAGDQLWRTVYADLKNLARSALRRGRRDSRNDATSLVNKAYLRLMGTGTAWSDRRHFFIIAARAMRYVLVDEARAQLALKRGNGQVSSLDQWPTIDFGSGDQGPEELLAIHQLLDRLRSVRPRLEELVELRYFAGLSVEECARVLDVTTRTVVRDWKSARLWLLDKLEVGA